MPTRQTTAGEGSCPSRHSLVARADGFAEMFKRRARVDLLAALIQDLPPKKGRITDLDDTLWAGILGEIGVESRRNLIDSELRRQGSGPQRKFQGDQIVLVTPPTRINGEIQTVELIWQRLPVSS